MLLSQLRRGLIMPELLAASRQWTPWDDSFVSL